jgi:hemerythrin superfamily protein
MPDTKMDAISMLEDDHTKVMGLFKEFEKARADDRKRELYETIKQELINHTTVEQEIFYPACQEDQEEDVAEAIEEHHVIEDLLHELEAYGPSDEEFDAKMAVMMENVEHHAKEEEEKKMFPRAKKDLGMERLRELGERMERRKGELQGGQARRSAA